MNWWYWNYLRDSLSSAKWQELTTSTLSVTVNIHQQLEILNVQLCCHFTPNTVIYLFICSLLVKWQHEWVPLKLLSGDSLSPAKRPELTTSTPSETVNIHQQLEIFSVWLCCHCNLFICSFVLFWSSGCHLEYPTLKILSTSHKTEAFKIEIKWHTFSGEAAKYGSNCVTLQTVCTLSWGNLFFTTEITLFSGEMWCHWVWVDLL